MKPFLALLAAAAATILLSSSCSSPASGPQTASPSSSDALAPAAFNDADVAFVNGMIPHHQQAIDMSALVPTRSTNDAVIKLAAEISAAQTPEIQVMKVLLVQWSAGKDDEHQDHGDKAMDGMMDPATMTKLESLRGAEFDKLWLQSMIGHHEGAITMAQTEVASGANDDAKRLAQQIIAGQQAEITQMKQMLGA